MSNQKLNKELKKKDLSPISLSNSIPLHIPAPILDKIKYLCQRIDKVEWSGVLLYSVKGTIKDFDKVEFTVEDILPMDKGTATFTGYELGDEIIEYRMASPERLSWKMGMIHSHHNMDSYFSSTDMSELSDNTEFHNYYLSLIVNNRGKMVAKVAFRGDVKGYECKDENGETWKLKLTKDKQTMFTFDCDIKTEKDFIKVPSEFSKRIETVIKECDAKRAIVAKKAKSFRQFPKLNTPNFDKKGNKLSNNPFNDLDLSGPMDGLFEDYEFDDTTEEEYEMHMHNTSFMQPTSKSVTNMTSEERIWDFARFVLRFGENLDVPDSLLAALEDSEVSVENPDQYVSQMIIMYPALFEKYWDVFGEINTEIFVDKTTAIMDAYSEYEGTFEVVPPLMEGLELMLEKMQV